MGIRPLILGIRSLILGIRLLILDSQQDYLGACKHTTHVLSVGLAATERTVEVSVPEEAAGLWTCTEFDHLLRGSKL